MSETGETDNLEERVFLTIDFDGDFMGLVHLTEDFGDKVHAVKLGQGFPLDERSHVLRKEMQRKHITMYLDAKYHEDPDQMEYVVSKSSELGYRYVSVAPSAGRAALRAAGMVQSPSCYVVAALSAGDKELSAIELSNIREANADLDRKHQINVLMCNVADIERAKNIGNTVVIATGIRMPGDESHDQLRVATPAEALRQGADFLAIGRAITEKPNRLVAYEQILENIASYR